MDYSLSLLKVKTWEVQTDPDSAAANDCHFSSDIAWVDSYVLLIVTVSSHITVHATMRLVNKFPLGL